MVSCFHEIGNSFRSSIANFSDWYLSITLRVSVDGLKFPTWEANILLSHLALAQVIGSKASYNIISICSKYS